MAVFLALLSLLVTHAHSQTLWIYDSESFRQISSARPSVGSTSSIDSKTLEECEAECLRVGLICLSFTWSGDTSKTDSTSTCNLYNTRFGFPSGGFDEDSDNYGNGGIVYLEAKDGSSYFEKPMDLSDTLGDHLIVNAMRLNNKNYNNYRNQQKNTAFDYDQFLLYYREGIPGYVNNSDAQSKNKYSVIKEMIGVGDSEQCAKYCTRDRGSIDAELGTRCVSFNYNKDFGGMCHLLTFSLDANGYDIEDLPSLGNSEETAKANNGWFYFEGLVGGGCWIVQGQCRKWNDETYENTQENNGKSFTVGGPQVVGGDVGIIREYAYDPICDKCTNDKDFNREYEYICLGKAREYHEEKCDNDADKATTAYWAQDGAGVADIWNSWDLTTGCVIDLSEFQCILPNGTNPRFEGKRFRDSIGEEEFSAGVDKKFCWARAAEWYDYCQLGGQSTDGNTVYLNVSWPSDGSFYLEPAIACKCDEYGLKIETEFGMTREYCTRDLTDTFCYREKQLDYWSQSDVLCDDLTTGYTCDTTAVSNEGSGCYLFYPQPSLSEATAISYFCGGGRYKFDAESFTEVNGVVYREISCAEQNLNNNCGEWTAETCGALAEKIHNECGNDLEDANEQIIVWFSPSGAILTFPQFAAPFEATVTRGFQPATAYTENKKSAKIDFMPIRNGRWQTFTPSESGNLRQLDVYYKNSIAAELSCTVWFGEGVTKSIFLGQVSVSADAQETADYIRFPLDDITLTAGELYTWQITATSANPDLLGDLGYVRGNGYLNGIGDLAWDYMFIAWVEGEVKQDRLMMGYAVIALAARPWFEIWCVMIIVLFLIFMVFLCILHWKRKYDEEQERKEDKKFQAELRQRALLQAEAERNAKNGVEEEDDYEDDDYDEYDERGGSVSDYEAEENDEYGDEELKDKQARTDNLLAPGDTNYNRVKSYSKNEMPGDGVGTDGYLDEEEQKRKRKRDKKRRKKKKRHQEADYEEY